MDYLSDDGHLLQSPVYVLEAEKVVFKRSLNCVVQGDRPWEKDAYHTES
jgi:hypothetical protein